MTLTIFGLLFVFNMAGSFHLNSICSSDNDCTNPDMYCYETGQCVQCVKCHIYNRLPSSRCAKDKNQCGNCEPGMEAESNLDGTFTCHPSGTSTPSTQAPDIKEPSDKLTIPLVVGAAIGLLLILCICGYCLYRETNICVNIREQFTLLMKGNNGECFKQPPQEDPPPPPYEERNPNASAPPFENQPTGSPELIYSKVIQPVENDPNQTATPFQCPTSYVRRGNLGTNPEPEDPDEDGEATEDDALLTSISHPDDEETQPSTWTPASGTMTASAIGPTSFAGALSVDSLRISQPNLTISTEQASQGSSSRSNSQPEFTFHSQNSSNSEQSDNNIHVNIINQIIVACNSNASSTASK